MSNLVFRMELGLDIILYCCKFLCLVFGVVFEFDALMLVVASSICREVFLMYAGKCT